tara:strand:- start:748 stop:1200 length:453 start_codon:yes stop_codon:yes gene_type:complete
MISFDIVIDYYNWKKNINNPKLHLRRKLLKLNQLNLFKNKSKNFTLLLTNNKKMRKLNKTFRNKNKSTDVLSFPFSKEVKIKKNKYLGDIAISYEIVKKRSKNSNFLLEFDKLWIHGYLHLLGYDHKKNTDYSKMLKIENLILNKFYKKN